MVLLQCARTRTATQENQNMKTEPNERIKSLDLKISDVESELLQKATQCIHFQNGQCTASEGDTCPFRGCDCSQSYNDGVREATERGFEGF